MMLTRADFKTLVASSIVVCIGVISLLIRVGERCVPRLYLIGAAALVLGGCIFILATLLAINTRHKEMKKQADKYLARLQKNCEACPDKDECNMRGRCDRDADEKLRRFME